MMKKHPILTKIRHFIGFVAVFAIAFALSPGSVFAQAPAGPMPSAAPADQPPPAAKPRTPAEIGGKPNLSGTWTLNKEDSDDPREKMQQAESSGGQRRGGWSAGGGMGGGGWGGMGGGRRGGGSGGGGGRGQGSGDDERGGMMNDLSQLAIEQTATSAKVTDESGRVLALYSSEGSSHSNSSASSSNGGSSTSSNSGANGDNSSAPPVAQWKDSHLVAVTPGRRQGKMTRMFDLSSDGKQLYMTTKMENPRFKNPVTIRLVYDPAPSGG